MAYTIRLTASAKAELKAIRLFERTRIIEEVERHLFERPGLSTRNRKPLSRGVEADFPFSPPLWELRVGDFRVFYDIDDSAKVVDIRAVRRKPPGLTTGEVINAGNNG